MSGTLTLRWLPGRYVFCRLPREHGIPDWARLAAGFVSITRLDDEISIIVPEECIPLDDHAMKIEAGWAAMRIVGTLEFNLVGILARLSAALADAGIAMCAVSTFDTDILLVKAEDMDRAAEALSAVASFGNSSADSPKEVI